MISKNHPCSFSAACSFPGIWQASQARTFELHVKHVCCTRSNKVLLDLRVIVPCLEVVWYGDSRDCSWVSVQLGRPYEYR